MNTPGLVLLAVIVGSIVSPLLLRLFIRSPLKGDGELPPVGAALDLGGSGDAGVVFPVVLESESER